MGEVIAGNETLFTLLGISYGGDGRTNFALPKMDPPPVSPEGTLQYIICMQGVYPTRS